MKNFTNKLLQKHKECDSCPTNEEVAQLFTEYIALLYPQFSSISIQSIADVEHQLMSLRIQTANLLNKYPTICNENTTTISEQLIQYLPVLHDKLEKDISAIYQEDPAAKSEHEVIRCYPGFYAIAAYRLANKFHQLGVQLIPRIITEHAHSRTGIDIHPGATIGEYFCIDHGTGVVIGETTVIGNNVKLYQGVTLGALSVAKEDANQKRHPTLQDNVLVYSNATILGGNTEIGEHCMIGGNVWITKSVPAHSKVYYVSGKNQVEQMNTEL